MNKENEYLMLHKQTDFIIQKVEDMIECFQIDSNVVITLPDLKCIVEYSHTDDVLFVFDKTTKIQLVIPPEAIALKIQKNRNQYLKEIDFNKYEILLINPLLEIKIGLQQINYVIYCEEYTKFDYIGGIYNVNYVENIFGIDKLRPIWDELMNKVNEKMINNNNFGFNSQVEFFESNDLLFFKEIDLVKSSISLNCSNEIEKIRDVLERNDKFIAFNDFAKDKEFTGTSWKVRSDIKRTEIKEENKSNLAHINIGPLFKVSPIKKEEEYESVKRNLDFDQSIFKLKGDSQRVIPIKINNSNSNISNTSNVSFVKIEKIEDLMKKLKTEISEKEKENFDKVCKFSEEYQNERNSITSSSVKKYAAYSDFARNCGLLTKDNTNNTNNLNNN